MNRIDYRIPLLLAFMILFRGITSFAQDTSIDQDIQVIALEGLSSPTHEQITQAVQEVMFEDAKQEALSGSASGKTKTFLFISENKKDLASTGFGILASYTLGRAAYDDENDKQKHVLVGAFIAGGSYLLTKNLLPHSMSKKRKQTIASIVATLSTLTAAIGKEIYDGQGHGTQDSRDAYATVLGGAVTLFSANIAF